MKHKTNKVKVSQLEISRFPAPSLEFDAMWKTLLDGDAARKKIKK